MDEGMFCLTCDRVVKPRSKWAVDAVVWICPTCGKYLDYDFIDDDENQEDDEVNHAD